MTRQIEDKYIYENEEYDIIALENELDFEIESLGVNPVPSGTYCWRGYYCTYSIQGNGIFLKDLNLSITGEYPEVNGITAVYEEFDVDFNDIDLYLYDEGIDSNVNNRKNDGNIEEVVKKVQTVDEKLDLEFQVENDLLMDSEENEIEDEKAEDIDLSEWGNGFRVYNNINIPINYNGGIIIGKEYMDKKYPSLFYKLPHGYITVYELVFKNGQLVKKVNRKKEMREVRKEIVKKGLSKIKNEYGLNKFIKEILGLDYEIKLYAEDLL